MNIEEIRSFALSLADVTEGFPFGEDTLVFKTNDKIFLLLSLSASPLQFNVKCDPENAVVLREQFAAVVPGYHMNKKHWNTVLIDGSISGSMLRGFIKDSHSLVAKPAKKSKATPKNNQ